MPDTSSYLQEVGRILRDISRIGFQPVLIGGMALITLGSRRVTRDFDFLISKPEEGLPKLLKCFYKRGLELASKLDENGEVLATIDNSMVAEGRILLDKPDSVYFLNPKTGLRIDLLFDFPLPAREIANNAKKTKIQSYEFHIASEEDLLRLKKKARAGRNLTADAQDIEFLTQRRKR